MCGICGYIDINSEITNKNTISNMSKLISHRGPDDQGIEILNVFGVNNVAVAHNRLSIRDVSINGHQPMFNTKGDICIAYNGEVYNIEKYRNELISMGIRFRGSSDTEVILYLYQQYGIDKMLEKLDGMFAIFIADSRKKKVYLIRDRVGVKPMYYYRNNSTFMFSSEIKCFYSHPQFKNELNSDFVTEYFMFRYVAGRDNLLKNVFTLLPGHYMEIDLNYEVREVKYWDITDIKKGRKFSNSEIEQVIEKSIKDRLISDVKVGVQLSGGVDSSVVTAKVVDGMEEDYVEAFSIVFENYYMKDGDLSEKKWINQVVSKERIISNQYVLSADDFYKYYTTGTWHLYVPMSIPNSIGIYYLCEKAYKKGIKVLLTGEGADEVMGGYWKYSKFIYSVRHPRLQVILDQILRRQMMNLGDSDENIIFSSSWIKKSDIDSILLKPNVADAYDKRKQILDNINCDELVEKFLNYDICTYMQDILNRQDKMSMAASVETRVPFLGLDVISAIRQQDTSRYVKEGYFSWDVSHNTKIPLKVIAEKRYGKEFAYRNKNGFGLPMREYFMNPEFGEHVEKVIFPYLQEQRIVDINSIWGKWRKRNDVSYKDISDLWIAISFGEWSRLFLEDKKNITEFRKAG